MKITKTILILIIFLIPGTDLLAATTDGSISLNGHLGLANTEYRWNTDQIPMPGYSKWETHNYKSKREYDDGSGGNDWDLNFLGTDVDRSGATSLFQFGAVGGNILSGQNVHRNRNLELGDIAINVHKSGESYVDPTINGKGSAGWDYAIRLLSLTYAKGLAGNQKQANFELMQYVDGSSWEGRNIYDRNPDGSEGYVTETYQMLKGKSVKTFSGIYTDNGGDKNVLEGSFDLSLLSLFDEATGGSIITYLTMSCVNDEAIVYADVAPVPLPSAVWLFGSALIGFIGVSRRTRV